MTVRSKVATVFLLGFFLDLINMFIASVAFPTQPETDFFPHYTYCR